MSYYRQCFRLHALQSADWEQTILPTGQQITVFRSPVAEDLNDYTAIAPMQDGGIFSVSLRSKDSKAAFAKLLIAMRDHAVEKPDLIERYSV